MCYPITLMELINHKRQVYQNRTDIDGTTIRCTTVMSVEALNLLITIKAD